MEHIIILPSDACETVYPDNKISNFKVDLEPPIDLSHGDSWEVALLDINYPTRWNNVLSRDEMILTTHIPGKHLCSISVPPGDYDVRLFVKTLHAMNRALLKARHHHYRRMSLTKQDQFVLWTNANSNGLRSELIFTAPLAHALGVYGFTPLNRPSKQENGSFLMLDNVIPSHVEAEMKT